jgi:hypothetical protein
VRVLVSYLSQWQNNWGNHLERREGLFRLMVSEVSVHSLGTLLFWNCEGSMLSIWQRTAHLMAAKMQKKRQEEARLPMSPSRSHSCDPWEKDIKHCVPEMLFPFLRFLHGQGDNETTYESKLGPEWNIWSVVSVGTLIPYVYRGNRENQHYLEEGLLSCINDKVPCKLTTQWNNAS